MFISNIGTLAKHKLVPGVVCPEDYKPFTTSWQDCGQAAADLGYKGDSVAHVDFVPRILYGTNRLKDVFLEALNPTDFTSILDLEETFYLETRSCVYNILPSLRKLTNIMKCCYKYMDGDTILY